uniref:Uncharacterized protein n=1 Tax=Arundo donax TaxID=35708 RepID=A0A0A8ZVK6_ARUDO
MPSTFSPLNIAQQTGFIN